jgi:glucose-6-phosphate isomerase
VFAGGGVSGVSPGGLCGVSPGGLCGELDALAGRLEAARAAVMGLPTTGQDEAAGVATGWVGLPDRILADFRTERPSSELARLLKTARRIREAVDRVVLLGGRDLLAGPRAVFEACCHPHHNELPRWDRGGRPRLSFAGCDLDNDATQGLLDLVAPRRDAAGIASGPPAAVDLLDRWSLVIADRGGDALGTAATTRLFLATLLEQCDEDAAELVVPIMAAAAPLAAVARAIGCVDAFSLPAGGAGPTAVLTAAGVLPCAIVGIDVVRLLEGAASMHRRFCEAPVADNPVLQYAGVAYLAATRFGASGCVLVPGSSRLEAVCRWYDELVADSLGGAPDCTAAGSSPAAPSARADPPWSRGLRHGAAGPVVTRLRVAEPRRDRLSLPALERLAADEDRLACLVGTTWPMLHANGGLARHANGGLARHAAAVDAAREPDLAAHRPVADLLLPRLDEHAIGQLLQMLMLATLIEAHLGV